MVQGAVELFDGSCSLDAHALKARSFCSEVSWKCCCRWLQRERRGSAAARVADRLAAAAARGDTLHRRTAHQVANRAHGRRRPPGPLAAGGPLGTVPSKTVHEHSWECRGREGGELGVLSDPYMAGAVPWEWTVPDAFHVMHCCVTCSESVLPTLVLRTQPNTCWTHAWTCSRVRRAVCAGECGLLLR